MSYKSDSTADATSANTTTREPSWHAPSQAWIFSTYAGAFAALRDPRLSVANMGERITQLSGIDSDERARLEQFFRDFLSLNDGLRHAELRRALAPFVSRTRMEELREPIEKKAQELATEADPDAIEPTFVRPYVTAALALVIGTDGTAVIHAMRALVPVMSLLGANMPSDSDARRALNGLDKLSRIVGNTADTEVHSADEPTNGSDTRSAIVAQLILGGLEPVSTCLTSSLENRSRDGPQETNREALDHVRIHDIVRTHSPFRLLPRVANTDIDWHRQRIPAGSRVILDIGSANREEGRQGESRNRAAGTGSTRLAFGGGKHRCPAAHLTTMLLEIAFAALSRNNTMHSCTATAGIATRRTTEGAQ